jgi:FixJ family two-component response regulator
MISIVDDDDFVRESIRTLVESLGYEVATFESAERSLESGRLPETSCLITDLQMPRLSGLDLQGRLIADGHPIPVIFITAFPDEKFRVRAMSAGAVGFLSKPFDESLLISCLDSGLNPSMVPSKRPVHGVCLNQSIGCAGQQPYATILRVGWASCVEYRPWAG